MRDTKYHMRFYFDHHQGHKSFWDILMNVEHTIAFFTPQEKPFGWEVVEKELTERKYTKVKEFQEIRANPLFKSCTYVLLNGSLFAPNLIEGILDIFEMFGVKEYEIWAKPDHPAFIITPTCRVALAPRFEEKDYPDEPLPYIQEEKIFLSEPLTPEIILERCGNIKGGCYLGQYDNWKGNEGKDPTRGEIKEALRAWYQQINCLCCKNNEEMNLKYFYNNATKRDELTFYIKCKKKAFPFHFDLQMLNQSLNRGQGLEGCYPEAIEFEEVDSND